MTNWTLAFVALTLRSADEVARDIPGEPALVAAANHSWRAARRAFRYCNSRGKYMNDKRIEDVPSHGDLVQSDAS